MCSDDVCTVTSLCIPRGIPLRDQFCVPGQGPTGPVHSLQVSVAQVQLTAHQDDRSAGAEVLDLRVPHGLHVVQRVGVCDGETEHHHIRPDGGRRGRGGREGEVERVEKDSITKSPVHRRSHPIIAQRHHVRRGRQPM